MMKRFNFTRELINFDALLLAVNLIKDFPGSSFIIHGIRTEEEENSAGEEEEINDNQTVNLSYFISLHKFRGVLNYHIDGNAK